MLTSRGLNADLAFALSLAAEADKITMKSFQSATLSVRTKSDRSPVSEADEAAETMLRDRISRERHGDGIVGEEFGVTGSSARRWILDPIDGTRNYVRGVPVWGTLIALEEEGKMRVGVISAPALNRRWWASAGDGAFCDNRRIRVSSIDAVKDAFVGYPSLIDFDNRGKGDSLLRLVHDCERSRGFGDFWQHMLVAEGAIDVALEPVVALWDMAPVQVIVEEAGGRFTTLNGEPRADGGNAVSTNGKIHDEVLRYFR